MVLPTGWSVTSPRYASAVPGVPGHWSSRAGHNGALTSPVVANRKKTRKPRKPQHHLPKVGTPADDAYRQQRSREDVVDFGLGRHRRSPITWVIALVVVVAVVGGVIGLILLTS